MPGLPFLFIHRVAQRAARGTAGGSVVPLEPGVARGPVGARAAFKVRVGLDVAAMVLGDPDDDILALIQAGAM